VSDVGRAAVLELFLGEADGGDFRMGENGMRHVAFIDGRGDALEKFLPEELDLEGGGVLEHVAAVDVARGVDAGDGGFEVLVDGEETFRVCGESGFR